MVGYFSAISKSKSILWCYLIWYLTTLYYHFDSSIYIWINSLGISLIIGFALQLRISTPTGWKTNKSQTFRLFLMPFCVSSFSSLIKGKGFILIFPSNYIQLLVSIFNCLLFLGFIWVLKKKKIEH